MQLEVLVFQPGFLSRVRPCARSPSFDCPVPRVFPTYLRYIHPRNSVIGVGMVNSNCPCCPSARGLVQRLRTSNSSPPWESETRGNRRA